MDLQTIQPVLKQNHKKGKRKGRKVKENETFGKDEGLTLVGSPQDVADHAEAASSNEEDIEMEDACERDGVDADNATKTEEDCKSQLEQAFHLSFSGLNIQQWPKKRPLWTHWAQLRFTLLLIETSECCHSLSATSKLMVIWQTL